MEADVRALEAPDDTLTIALDSRGQDLVVSGQAETAPHEVYILMLRHLQQHRYLVPLKRQSALSLANLSQP